MASETGAELIAAERARQVEQEGWTLEHDATDREVEENTDCPVCAVNGYGHKPYCSWAAALTEVLSCENSRLSDYPYLNEDDRWRVDNVTRLLLAARAAAAPDSGAALIAVERARQVEQEGWTLEHDADHSYDQLAQAAASYAMPARFRPIWDAPFLWPWHASYWKPTPDDRVRELVKAGALIAAEIDRLRGQS